MGDQSLMPDGNTAGWVGALSASLAAFINSRRAPSKHAMGNAIGAAVGPIATKVAVLETHYEDTARRLGAIEMKLDKILDRL